MARKREFDKEAVLQKAMLLFWAQGYEATSIRALTKAMGISTSSMYETFGDKRSIFLAALERYCEIERAQVAQMAHEASDARQFIQSLFASIDDVVPDASQHNGSMTFNAMAEFGMRDADLTELLFTHYLAITEIIATILRQAQQGETISANENPLHLAHVILSSLHGLATIKSMKPDYAYADAFQHIVLQILNS